MKSVLISIRPHWALLIAEGKKTIEIRKTRPKLQTPFKVYIYCTKDFTRGTLYIKPLDLENAEVLQGKVIGEFVCDKITYLGNISTDTWCYLLGDVHEYHKRLVTKDACLTEEELLKYGGKYGWHISNLVIYDKPRELSEFSVYKKNNCPANLNGVCLEREQNAVILCEHLDCQHKKITRPPQDWCYVESEVEGE